MAAYLTERQKKVLDFLRDYDRRHGYAPTLREICARFGYSSFGTVQKHLKLLEGKGYLRRHRNQKRGLELTGLDLQRGERTGRGGRRGEGISEELPFFGVIAAGRPIEAVPGDETVAVPGHLLHGRKGQHYVLKVVGDSMIEEGIHDGDLVIVLRREEARAGEMVVALYGGEVTLKRFYPEGGSVRLQPANRRMEPLRVPAADVQVQGIVVGLMRRF